jgi:hypothetical protein
MRKVFILNAFPIFNNIVKSSYLGFRKKYSPFSFVCGQDVSRHFSVAYKFNDAAFQSITDQHLELIYESVLEGLTDYNQLEDINYSVQIRVLYFFHFILSKIIFSKNSARSFDH